MASTWVVPFDGSLNTILRVLRLVRHHPVALYCPSNLFAKPIWQCRLQQLQTFAANIHSTCNPHQSTQSLQIIAEPILHLYAVGDGSSTSALNESTTLSADRVSSSSCCISSSGVALASPPTGAMVNKVRRVDDDQSIRSMDDLSHPMLVTLAEHLYSLVQDANKQSTQQHGTSVWTMAWPYEWSSALSIDMCQDTTHVQLLDSIDPYIGMQNSPSSVEHKLSALLDIWNTCINTLQEHFTYEELVDECQSLRSHLLASSLVCINPRFQLWSQPLDCPNAYPSNTSCCRNDCAWCCQVQQFVEENSVANTILDAATE